MCVKEMVCVYLLVFKDVQMSYFGMKYFRIL